MSLSPAQTAQFTKHITKFGAGGQSFVFTGMATRVEHKVHKDSGELQGICTVLFVGGDKYVRFADPDDVKAIPDGAWIKVEANVSEFRDRTFATDARLVEVNGKPFDRSTTQAA
ncbi:MAG: hypothetical protein AAGH99_00315 [Planctomycetota bacterium]